MSVGPDDAQRALIIERVRMSMPALCDALSITSVVTSGEPSTAPLDIALESAVAMAVASMEGSVNGSMMIALLPGASAEITDSETLATELGGALDADGGGGLGQSHRRVERDQHPAASERAERHAQQPCAN